MAALAIALVACSERSEQQRSEQRRSEQPGPSPAAAPAREPPTPEPSANVGWDAIDPPASPGALGMSLASHAHTLFATWLEPLGDGHRLRSARHEDGRWSEPVTIVEGAELIANWADFPRAERGGDGAWYVSHLRRSGEAAYAYEIRLSRTRDGERFEHLGVVHRDGTPTEHGFVSMVPTPDGVRLFWLDGRANVEEGGATAVYSGRVAAEIGDAEVVDRRACDCCQTDAALTETGPLVVYRDRADGEEIRDISASRRIAEAFSAPTPVHADRWEMAGCPVNGPSVAAAQRQVAVAWFTGAEGGAVRVAFSDDAGATFDEPVDVDPHQPPGRVDAVLAEGGAVVSWLARAARGGEIRVRFVGRDGTLGAPSRVASTGLARAAGFPVMTRRGDELVVGYRDTADPPRLHVRTLPLAALGRARGSDAAPPGATVAVGHALTDASVRDETDAARSLAELASERPLLVAFFARWCQPCREELRMLERLRVQHPELRVIAVSLDETSHRRAEAVARGWGFEGEIARDGGAAGTLGVPPLPGLFLVGDDGRLRWSSVGRVASAAEVEAALQIEDDPAAPEASPRAVRPAAD